MWRVIQYTGPVRDFPGVPAGNEVCYYIKSGDVMSMDANRLERHLGTFGVSQCCRRVHEHPSGSLVMGSIHDSSITKCDPHTGRSYDRFECIDTHVVALSPDGRLVAVGDAETTLALYTWSGERVASTTVSRVSEAQLAFSPDSQFLCVLDLHNVIGVYRVQDLALVRSWHCETSGRMSITPAGDVIISRGSRYLVVYAFDGRFKAYVPGVDRIAGFYRSLGCVLDDSLGIHEFCGVRHFGRMVVWARMLASLGRQRGLPADCQVEVIVGRLVVADTHADPRTFWLPHVWRLVRRAGVRDLTIRQPDWVI